MAGSGQRIKAGGGYPNVRVTPKLHELYMTGARASQPGGPSSNIFQVRIGWPSVLVRTAGSNSQNACVEVRSRLRHPKITWSTPVPNPLDPPTAISESVLSSDPFLLAGISASSGTSQMFDFCTSDEPRVCRKVTPFICRGPAHWTINGICLSL